MKRAHHSDRNALHCIPIDDTGTLKGAAIMKLSAPKHVTWWIAIICGGLGVLEHYRVVHLPLIGPYSSLLVIGAWALLIVATLLKDL
jgi:hypothetical protein